MCGFDAIFCSLNASENAAGLILRSASGDVEIKKEDIANRENTRRSLMPEGLLRDMTPQQPADLRVDDAAEPLVQRMSSEWEARTSRWISAQLADLWQAANPDGVFTFYPGGHGPAFLDPEPGDHVLDSNLHHHPDRPPPLVRGLLSLPLLCLLRD